MLKESLLAISVLLALSVSAPGKVFYATSYGVRCDGQSNDLDAINVALEDVSRRAGTQPQQILHLPAGICIIAGERSILLRSNVLLRGMGSSDTILMVRQP